MIQVLTPIQTNVIWYLRTISPMKLKMSLKVFISEIVDLLKLLDSVIGRPFLQLINEIGLLEELDICDHLHHCVRLAGTSRELFISGFPDLFMKVLICKQIRIGQVILLLAVAEHGMILPDKSFTGLYG